MRKKRVKGLSSSERKRERNEMKTRKEKEVYCTVYGTNIMEKVKGKRNERCSKADSECIVKQKQRKIAFK